MTTETAPRKANLWIEALILGACLLPVAVMVIFSGPDNVPYAGGSTPADFEAYPAYVARWRGEVLRATFWLGAVIGLFVGALPGWRRRGVGFFKALLAGMPGAALLALTAAGLAAGNWEAQEAEYLTRATPLLLQLIGAELLLCPVGLIIIVTAEHLGAPAPDPASDT